MGKISKRYEYLNIVPTQDYYIDNVIINLHKELSRNTAQQDWIKHFFNISGTN